MTKRADTTPAGPEVEAGPIPGYAAAADQSGQGEARSDQDGDGEDDLALEVEVEPPEKSAAETIAELEAKQKDTYDRYVRSVAELDNYRKRTRKEIDDARTDAQSRVLREMLPVIDNLERALSAAGAAEATDGHGIIDGVRLVFRQFAQALERCNVTPVVAKGAPFDPTQHEAVSQIETAETPPGSVVDVLQTGYRIGDRLLRPALVVVAKAPSAGAAGERGNGAADADGDDGGEPAGPNGHDPDAA